jgi:hypothetical protein
MKRKTFYIIMVICCLSLFSSAKQVCKGSDINVSASKKEVMKQSEKSRQLPAYDLSPIKLFLFRI